MASGSENSPRRATAHEAVPALVLFDRDGTLIEDVPYNGDPEQVRPVPGAGAALARLRRRGIAVGLVTNQSGIARGLIDTEQVDRVNARVAALLGPFDTVRCCPHGPESDCTCRKPRPGMIVAAAAELGVPLERCAMVGDIGSDVRAGVDAGARSILVPNEATLDEEVLAAPEVAPDLSSAVALMLHDVVAGPPERAAGHERAARPERAGRPENAAARSAGGRR